MTPRRMVLAATCVAIAALAWVFAVAGPDDTAAIAAAVSALAAVATVGVGLSEASAGTESVVQIDHTGAAIADGPDSAAITGSSSLNVSQARSVELRNTGPAIASGGGKAVTGFFVA